MIIFTQHSQFIFNCRIVSENNGKTRKLVTKWLKYNSISILSLLPVLRLNHREYRFFPHLDNNKLSIFACCRMPRQTFFRPTKTESEKNRKNREKNIYRISFSVYGIHKSQLSSKKTQKTSFCSSVIGLTRNTCFLPYDNWSMCVGRFSGHVLNWIFFSFHFQLH